MFAPLRNCVLVFLLVTLSLGANNVSTNNDDYNTQEQDTGENQQHEGPLLRHQQTSHPYKERLDITTLPRNHLLTSFDFQLESEAFNVSAVTDSTHYKVFPRSLAPIIESTDTRELHLRFGQGWWDSEEWGQLPNYGYNAGGIGVEVWAVIEAKNKSEAFEKWKRLTSSLSGLFCASLNFIDSSKTIYPRRSFGTNEKIPLFDLENQVFLLRAALASEPVCTENLTPFVKFLPTRGKAGLSSLLDGHRVFESQWHMMSVDIETKCHDNICQYKMDQKVDAVVNIERSLRKKFNPIPKPLPGDQLRCDLSKPYDAFQCFPLGDEKSLSFSLNDIFGREIKGANMISNEAGQICVHTSKDWEVMLAAQDEFFSTDSNCFDLNRTGRFDIHFKTENSSNVPPVSPAPVLVSRSLTGYAQDKGDSRISFDNPTEDQVRLLYTESLPWFMKIYLHSLRVSGAQKDEIIKSIFYLPQVDRQRPTHIEFEIVLPPKSKVSLSYSFDKSLLLYAEYPPDANHGFSVEPGVVNILEPYNYFLRTSPALLTLPTPDFSMPYNVIILTSTVMALSFGTIFNLLVKRVVTEEEAELIFSETGPKAKIEKVKNQLKERLGLLKKKVVLEKEKQIEE